MPSFKITQILTVASLLLVDSTVTAVRSFNAAPKHAQLRRRDASFEPRMDGNDLIYVEDFNGFSAPAAVRLSLSPKMPTLIHDDISDHVVEVSCADSTILVKFHGEESMLKARDAWNTNSDFVFVTSQPGCASFGEHAAYVVSYAAATAQSITLKSSPTTLRDSTHNMYVNLGRHIVPEVEPREMSRIMRRSQKEMVSAAMPPAPSSSAPAPPAAAASVPANNLTATATTIYRTAESPLTQTYNWSPPTAQPTTADVVADISFERIDTVLLPPSEDIAALLPAADIIENFELRCANCSLTGTLELDVAGFNIDSNAFEQITEFVQDGTFEFVANNVFGNFEFDFVIQEGFSVPLFDGLLPPIPLTPFAIPGVVNFGPALELTFPIAITLDKDVVFTTGFTLDVPDGSRVVLNVGDIGASNSTGFQDSVLEPIPFSTNAGDLSVTLSAGFRPQLVISAEVGNDLIANIGGGVGAFLDVPELSLTISSLQNQNPTCDGPAPAGEENTRLLVEAAATLRAGAFFELEVGVGLLDFGLDGEQELASITFPITSQCLLFNSETSSTEPGPQVPVPAAGANATEAAPPAPAADATKAALQKPAAEATKPTKHMMPQASVMATPKPMTKRETGAASSFYVPTCVIALIGTAIGFANL